MPAPDSPAEEASVRKWIEEGGMVLRFAGPRLAEQTATICCRCRLRRGGRTIGGALSWEKPARLAPFAADSPFAGLAIPADVTVSRQVLAEPTSTSPARPGRGLPTARRWSPPKSAARAGLVLVHTTANAEWSNLALSGLFVQMLRRIVAMSQGVAAAGEGALPPVETLDGFGRLQHAPANAPADRRQGDRDDHSRRRAIRRAFTAPPIRAARSTCRPRSTSFAPIGELPEGVVARELSRGAPRSISARRCWRPPCSLRSLDLVIAYALRGLLRRRRGRGRGRRSLLAADPAAAGARAGR